MVVAQHIRAYLRTASLYYFLCMHAIKRRERENMLFMRGREHSVSDAFLSKSFNVSPPRTEVLNSPDFNHGRHDCRNETPTLIAHEKFTIGIGSLVPFTGASRNFKSISGH